MKASRRKPLPHLHAHLAMNRNFDPQFTPDRRALSFAFVSPRYLGKDLLSNCGIICGLPIPLWAIGNNSRASFFHWFRPTSKMSHAHGWRASCGLRLLRPWFHSIQRTLAGGVTAVGVGSGALLALFFEVDILKISIEERSRQSIASLTFREMERHR